MSAFEDAYQFTMKAEGGKANHKADKGGATLNGVSSRYHPVVYKKLKELIQSGKTEEAAAFRKDFYKREFWDKIKGDQLPYEMAKAAFDTAVIGGPGLARKLLTRSDGDVNRFLDLRQAHHDRVAQTDVTQKAFIRGWTNRVNALRKDVSKTLGSRAAFDTVVPAPVQTDKVYKHRLTFADGNTVDVTSFHDKPEQVVQAMKLGGLLGVPSTPTPEPTPAPVTPIQVQSPAAGPVAPVTPAVSALGIKPSTTFVYNN